MTIQNHEGQNGSGIADDEKLEHAGLFGRASYEESLSVGLHGRCRAGLLSLHFQKRPDANFDPPRWAAWLGSPYRDVRLTENYRGWKPDPCWYADRLGSICVPTLITVGDHDNAIV